MAEKEQADRVLDELAAKVQRSDLDKLDDSFVERVDRLAKEQKIDKDTLAKLHAMWKMLKASDEDVPWTQKAIIMAAIGYFASPFDIIPDFIGGKGYADDALVIRLAFGRLGSATASYLESP